MKRLVPLLLLVACVTNPKGKGSSGNNGESGPPGPAGPPGEGLVFKDKAGAMVDGAYPMFHDHVFSMVVTNAEGVFFEFTPLTGAAVYSTFDSSSLQRHYLTSNCSGDVIVRIPVAPGVAFKYNNRIVALPSDTEMINAVGSAWGGSSCSTGPYPGEFVRLSTLDALPTIAPPLLGPGPYHVERI